MSQTFRSGLEGVVAAETRLSRVDGERGELVIGGYPVEVLAPSAIFEETAHLLWHGTLPDEAALADLRSRLAAQRRLPSPTLDLLAAAAARDCDPMVALRMGTASLDLDPVPDEPIAAGARITAMLPTLVAAYARIRRGLEPIDPDPRLAHVANYLYMLEGEPPSAERTRALETYFNTVVDHGMNASTFTARVIIATRSDMVSAITGAVGALKGPLHGGAPGPALDMVFEIGAAERAEAHIREKLARGERLMGFGHRVYKVRDPRAEVLSAATDRMAAGGEAAELVKLARAVEKVALRVLAEEKPERRLDTNVEYYTALLLHGVGLDKGLFTPTFALARVVGWTAHCVEHLATGRLIRPASSYVGEIHRQWPGAGATIGSAGR